MDGVIESGACQEQLGAKVSTNQHRGRVGGALNQHDMIELEQALSRRNTSVAALGQIKRFRLFGGRLTMYRSPDQCTWLVPTGITLSLMMGTLYVTWSAAPWGEWLVLMSLAITALIASFLVTATDPGIYPRLCPGEEDPLEYPGSTYVRCRVCNVRRPPRASHCYQCNVCVLEHDHHCGVLGGCVGIRSLRWFTLYLTSISTASLLGCFWLVMDIMGYRKGPTPLVGGGTFVPSAHQAMDTVDLLQNHMVGTTLITEAPHTSTTPEATSVKDRYKRRFGNLGSTRRHADDINVLNVTMDIMLLIFVGNVVLVVGGLGCYYLYLMLTDTTRREAQGKMTRIGMLSAAYAGGRYAGRWGHIKKSFFPPPSMVEVPSNDTARNAQSSV